jgi:hypothetical protein
MPKYKGWCCVCQQKDIPVYPVVDEEEEYEYGPSHPFKWHCEPHDAFGCHCPGSGTCPQAVYVSS